MTNNRWTKEEVAWLRKVYPKEGSIGFRKKFMKRNISAIQFKARKLGLWFDRSFHVPWNKGLTAKNDSRVRYGKFHPMFGKHHSVEARRKIGLALKGKKLSKKRILIIKKSHPHLSGKNHPMYGKKGRLCPNFGKCHSIETRKKISEFNKKRFGNNPKKHPNWRGGISRKPYAFGFTEELKEMIRDYYKRKCIICLIPENGKKLMVHHIDYNKMNINPKNLVPLCNSCHSITNYNREYWQNYFQDVVDSLVGRKN